MALFVITAYVNLTLSLLKIKVGSHKNTLKGPALGYPTYLAPINFSVPPPPLGRNSKALHWQRSQEAQEKGMSFTDILTKCGPLTHIIGQLHKKKLTLNNSISFNDTKGPVVIPRHFSWKQKGSNPIPTNTTNHMNYNSYAKETSTNIISLTLCLWINNVHCTIAFTLFEIVLQNSNITL